MIKAYKNNYSQYFQDQITRFESFEKDLYAEGIKNTIDFIFKDYNPEFNRVLDFCCGDGTGSGFIKEMGFDVVGFDGNPNKITKAIENHPNVIFTCTEVISMFRLLDSRNTSCFDIIYASHCFEHFLNPLQILSATKQMLLEFNGEIILILPYPNEESEGHPGSKELWLNKSLAVIKKNYEELGFGVERIEQMNFREPELLIILK
jgi:SAM-dependent methyltransferase